MNKRNVLSKPVVVARVAQQFGRQRLPRDALVRLPEARRESLEVARHADGAPAVQVHRPRRARQLPPADGMQIRCCSDVFFPIFCGTCKPSSKRVSGSSPCI